MTGKRCPDCHANEGALHAPGCDMERCPLCGGQIISCECSYKHFYPKYERDFMRTRGFTDADREHVQNCTAPDWTCATCAELEIWTNGLPANVYVLGLHDDQQTEWNRILKAKGRIPWIQYPNICCRCGGLWPKMFHVSDEEWDKYVEPAMRGDMLCIDCWEWIKSAVDGVGHE